MNLMVLDVKRYQTMNIYSQIEIIPGLLIHVVDLIKNGNTSVQVRYRGLKKWCYGCGEMDNNNARCEKITETHFEHESGDFTDTLSYCDRFFKKWEYKREDKVSV